MLSRSNARVVPVQAVLLLLGAGNLRARQETVRPDERCRAIACDDR